MSYMKSTTTGLGIVTRGVVIFGAAVICGALLAGCNNDATEDNAPAVNSAVNSAALSGNLPAAQATLMGGASPVRVQPGVFKTAPPPGAPSTGK